MELRKRIAVKVQAAIDNLGKNAGVLASEREQIDFDLNPQRFQSPDGKGYITSFYVSLFVPTDVMIDDRVTRDALLHDPYVPQDVIDRLVLSLWELIQDEKAEAAKEAPPGLRPPQVPKELRSPGGLILPKG